MFCALLLKEHLRNANHKKCIMRSEIDQTLVFIEKNNLESDDEYIEFEEIEYNDALYLLDARHNVYRRDESNSEIIILTGKRLANGKIQFITL